MSSSESDSDDVAVIRRLIEEGIDELDRTAIEETTAEEVELLGKGATVPRDSVVGNTGSLKQAIPDLTHEIHSIWEADGHVIVHYTNRGTFENELDLGGPAAGIDIEAEPNGQEIEYSGSYIARVEDGRVSHWANYSESLSAFQQLGVVEL
jgi:predicted ester cyclase